MNKFPIQFRSILTLARIIGLCAVLLAGNFLNHLRRFADAIGKKLPAGIKRPVVFVCAVATFVISIGVFGQATTLVRPRQLTLMSNALFTAQMATNTNTFFGTQFNVGVWTNTLIPFSGAHAVGLSVVINNTNKFAAATSNLNIAVYGACDTSITPAGVVGIAYGTNFGQNPIIEYSVPFGCATQSGSTNQVWVTNLTTSVWEPYTSLGFTVTNTTLSNLLVTVTLSPVP